MSPACLSVTPSSVERLIVSSHTEEQKESNRIKSKIRCRGEHIFGFMNGALHGITIRTIGMRRAKHQIEMLNLTYNLCRYAFLKQREPAAV